MTGIVAPVAVLDVPEGAEVVEPSGRPLGLPMEIRTTDVDAWRARNEAKSDYQRGIRLRSAQAAASVGQATARGRRAIAAAAVADTPDSAVSAASATTPDDAPAVPWDEPGKVPPALAAEVLGLLSEGSNAVEVAADLDATEADVTRLARYYGWPDKTQVTWALELLTEHTEKETTVTTTTAPPKPTPPRATPAATPPAGDPRHSSHRRTAPVVVEAAEGERRRAAAGNKATTPDEAADLLRRAADPAHSADVHTAAAAVWTALDGLVLVLDAEAEADRRRLFELEEEAARLRARSRLSPAPAPAPAPTNPDPEPSPTTQVHRSAHVQRAEADARQRAAIREWARGQGIKVSANGRIPGDVVKAYNAVHPKQ